MLPLRQAEGEMPARVPWPLDAYEPVTCAILFFFVSLFLTFWIVGDVETNSPSFVFACQIFTWLSACGCLSNESALCSIRGHEIAWPLEPCFRSLTAPVAVSFFFFFALVEAV